jgi:MOSC domain-containing protein YiiM
MSLVQSIQIGKIRTYGDADAEDPIDREWTTATFKEAVSGPVWLGTQGFDGDQVADPRFHGGSDKATLVYSADHYKPWERKTFFTELPFGAFGENISVSGMVEADVCIGDIYALGEARVQVSQPRQPCWKQARRWCIHDLVVQINRTGRTGWYLRVLREGHVQAGSHFVLEERPHSDWPLPRAHAVLNSKNSDVEAARELIAVRALAEAWRRDLRRRFQNL